MMKVVEKEKHVGYAIGKHVQIHPHVHDPESWFLTIRPLGIFGDPLCQKSCSEKEIARYVNAKLQKILLSVGGIINDVTPFT